MLVASRTWETQIHAASRSADRCRRARRQDRLGSATWGKTEDVASANPFARSAIGYRSCTRAWPREPLGTRTALGSDTTQSDHPGQKCSQALVFQVEATLHRVHCLFKWGPKPPVQHPDRHPETFGASGGLRTPQRQATPQRLELRKGKTTQDKQERGAISNCNSKREQQAALQRPTAEPQHVTPNWLRIASAPSRWEAHRRREIGTEPGGYKH